MTEQWRYVEWTIEGGSEIAVVSDVNSCVNGKQYDGTVIKVV